MIEVLVVGITLGLIFIASIFYRGGKRKRRVNLLRAACLGLFVASVCRSLEPVFDTPGIDLVKKIAILLAQVAVVLLMLTFRAKPLSKRMERAIYISAASVALVEFALMWFLPVHPNGNVFHQDEIEEAATLGQASALMVYHAVYLAAFSAAVVVAAIACWGPMTQRNQPLAARLPVTFIFAGAVGSFLFICSSAGDMFFGRPVLGGSDSRDILLIAVVTLFLIGLILGIVRGITISLRRTIAMRLAYQIVMPLWKTTTTLQPDVKLPPEEQKEFNQLMALSRITIETHDALRLIREDYDPALDPVRAENPEDPELSAQLVRHLGGERSVPRLGWLTIAMTRLRTLSIGEDDSLAKSVRSLYEIRVAMNTLGVQGP
jgi:hypothetical protein